MLLIITISVTLLVAINFILLIFSCNKTPKGVKTNKQPVIFKPEFTIELESHTLAPTGS